MHILILHMRFHPDLTGTGPLVTELATDLVAAGDKVTVVTGVPHYGQKQVEARYRGNLISREKFRGVTLLRTFVYVPPKPSGFHRSVNFLSYSLISIAAALMTEKPDAILCINPPITVGTSGYLVRIARRVPMVFNVQDIWPDCIEIIGQLRNPALIWLFRHMEKFIYRISFRVTVLSEGMRENLLGKGVPSDKIEVIPNWCDVEYLRPFPKNNGFRKKNGLDGRFIILFAGNIGYNSVLDTVIDVARELQNNDRFLFLIVGEGNAKASLIKYAKKLRLSNVRFLTTQPKEVLPEMLSAADVSLVTLHRSLGKLNVPSKTYSIMASGRPVLAAVPEDSEISRLVKTANCGTCVPPERPDLLAQAIVYLSKNPSLLQQYGVNGRNHVVKYYSRNQIVKRYHQLLHEAVA